MTTVIDLSPLQGVSRDQFRWLCEANPDLSLERSPQGDLIIMSPVGGEGGSQEASLITDLTLWNRQTQLGIVFSSSTIFSLPRGGDRSPDAAWVRWDRWQQLSPSEQEGFPPICPDFVIELRSRTDRLKPLQIKMQEYVSCGLQLGWLINPQDRLVEIYRQDGSVEVVSMPVELLGEDILPGFVLGLT